MKHSDEQRKFAEVIRGGSAQIRTRVGSFIMTAYPDRDGREHFAAQLGELRGSPPLVRLQSECATGELLDSLHCDCRAQLSMGLAAIQREGRGVLVYLRQEGRGLGLSAKLQTYDQQSRGADTVDANLALGYPLDGRTYTVAGHILRDLGVEAVQLLTNNPEKIKGLEAAGIKVARRVPHEVGIHKDNRRYMETKRVKMGHLLTQTSAPASKWQQSTEDSRCVECQRLLGVRQGGSVEIKSHKLRVSISGGIATIQCPRCGKFNTVILQF